METMKLIILFALLLFALLISRFAIAQDKFIGGGLETATSNGSGKPMSGGPMGNGIDWDRNNPGQGTIGAPGQSDEAQASRGRKWRD